MKSEEFIPRISQEIAALKKELPVAPISSKEEVDKVAAFAARVRRITTGVQDLRDSIMKPMRARLAVLTALWAAPVGELQDIERRAREAVGQYLEVKRAEEEAAREKRRAAEAAVHTGVAEVFANVGLSPEESERLAEKALSRADIAAVIRVPEQSVSRTAEGTVSLRKDRKWEVVNVDDLPEEFVTRTPNKKAIKAAVMAGRTIPGVRTWEESSTSLRVNPAAGNAGGEGA